MILSDSRPHREQTLSERIFHEYNQQFASIQRAEQASVQLRLKIESVVENIATDASLVVFGSTARNECTSGSDIDWTLLIDGQADYQHFKAAQEISTRFIQEKWESPTQAGPFGSIVFSHDLIHHIGGDRDSNHNMTQRILLLLESKPVGDAIVYERVVRGVLQRYLVADSGFVSSEGRMAKVPRFLLNDIVRFWRTICVDFAWKEWEQGGNKWALRNAKLRLSRKLLFVAGLLMIFSCYKNIQLANANSIDERVEEFIAHLNKYVEMTPLEIVFDALMNLNLKDELRGMLLCYNDFLELIDDVEKRKELERLGTQQTYDNPTFQEVRKLGIGFDNYLVKIFFEADTPLRSFTREYGVF